ncbi:MAG: serine protease [Gemmatimonadetes bacterium]|nr:serine protease [Gemmatimonadota bacterium]
MKYPDKLDIEQRNLANERQAQRVEAVRLIMEGRVLEVERDRDRLARFIARRVDVGLDVATAIAGGKRLETLELTPEQADAARDVTEIDNSVPVAFADRARTVSKAVGRLTTGSGRAKGTCFMISPRLVTTAGHVLPDGHAASRRRVEFDFERNGSRLQTRARFSLDPDTFFLSPQQLQFDCAIVALGDKLEATAFTPGHCPLSNRGNKHALGYVANIIHHPGGRTKQLVLRENRLIDRPEAPDDNNAVEPRDWLLVYRTQTDPGSSGAPVFNDDWDVLAVHFWGTTLPPLDLGCGVRVADQVNHGVRASAIYNRLRALRDQLTPDQQALLDEAAPPPGN